MANADFEQTSSHGPGGFAAGSYREAKAPESALRLTPTQKKLAALEQALPPALRQQAAAAALSLVLMAGCFVGFGCAKLQAQAREAGQWFHTGVTADAGYSLNEELTTRGNTAANIITTGTHTLGADDAAVQAAQAALENFSSWLTAVQTGGKQQPAASLSSYDGSAMHALYLANETLGSAIDQLYARLQEQAADPMKMGAVQGQYGQFNSSGTILGNLQYNQSVAAWQAETSGFPASLFKSLFGIEEVQPFA